MKVYKGAEVLTSASDEDKWPRLRPGHLTLGKEPGTIWTGAGCGQEPVWTILLYARSRNINFVPQLTESGGSVGIVTRIRHEASLCSKTSRPAEAHPVGTGSSLPKLRRELDHPIPAS
jgi:hypothetical protein